MVAPATPSVTPQESAYQKTSMTVTRATSIIDQAQTQIQNNTVVTGAVSPVEVTTLPNGQIAYTQTSIAPRNQDSYIQAGPNSVTSVTDFRALSSATVNTTTVQIKGLKLGSIQLYGVGYTKSFFYDSVADFDKKNPSEKGRTASFFVSREGEQCEITIGTIADVETEKVSKSYVGESCSFLNGAQAMQLAESFAKKIK